MKILCVIDSFGSGGAQRQMVNLACGLKSNGHDVELFIYFPQHNFFRPLVDKAGIRVHEVHKGQGFSFEVLWHLTVLLRSKRFDGVISFLNSPNIYCELAKLLSPGCRLVVSERSSFIAEGSPTKSLFRRLLHIKADFVVANSETHSSWLRRLPWLRKKVHAIYNGYAIPGYIPTKLPSTNTPFRYLVVGRINSGKNGIGLINALILYRRKNGISPLVSWAGRREPDRTSRAYTEEMERLLAQNPDIAARWSWLGEREDVISLLATYDALLHLSLFEGLPNVVCEAFIAGCPVIASNVCDHSLLVKDNIRGLLCDPLSADSICVTIKKFEALSAVERIQMGLNARCYAEEHLSIDRMVSSYEALLCTPTAV